MGKILVIGSSNTDLIATVKEFPAAGETIVGKSFMQAMGGKGANQAVAAHRLGGDVKFVTSVGNDANGQNALQYLSDQGVDVSSSMIVDGVPSGTAIILVDERGENCIVITPGANNMLSEEHIKSLEKEIEAADMLVLQMEIPFETVRLACETAHRHHKKVMLNVAPARQVDAGLMHKINYLIVNETEAEIISGERIEVTGEEGIIRKLWGMGAEIVVLTLGSKGCVMYDGSVMRWIPAFPVKPLDSTAAGDTFCGALAAELSRGIDLEEALIFASAASAICVTRMGAQPSIPLETEVRGFLAGRLEKISV